MARRIAALDGSDLPGRPRVWSVLGNAAVQGTDPVEVAAVRRRVWAEMVVAVAPWMLLIGLLAGVLRGSLFGVGGP